MTLQGPRNARLALLALLALAGCVSDPDAVSRSGALEDLACASGGGVEPWESAPWPPATAGACGWLDYPARVTLEIAHGLGRTPRDVSVTLSFSEDGSLSAPAAGDSARIVAVDDRAVTLSNGTNEDFFVKGVVF